MQKICISLQLAEVKCNGVCISFQLAEVKCRPVFISPQPAGVKCKHELRSDAQAELSGTMIFKLGDHYFPSPRWQIQPPH